MRLRILSRASDLARLQARLVGHAISASDPAVEIRYLTRTAAGDIDQTTPLPAFADKGAFTSDLSEALIRGDADIVVHSWKDLPLTSDERPETCVAATLERGDPRDVLLIRAASVEAQPSSLTVLSSSPRRMWLIDQTLGELLPWRVESIRCLPVRGNVPTRLRRLVEGQADGLVVAKAALDRLLGSGAPFEEAARQVRAALNQCRWMVLPLRDVPAAPAQGALAVEVGAASTALRERLQEINHAPTWRAVSRERAVLAEHGGGCHAAIGATVLVRNYGEITSVKARTGEDAHAVWALARDRPSRPRAHAGCVWPQPKDRSQIRRQAILAAPPSSGAYWIARADALPADWRVDGRIVWAAGGRTWRKLAARGVWVNGCADGLGDEEAPNVDLLAGETIDWRRLTHQAAAGPGAVATYIAEASLPEDLPSRTHFFWTSGAQARQAFSRWPELRQRWHASGPGRTAQTLRELLGRDAHADIWLDYDDWYRDVCQS